MFGIYINSTSGTYDYIPSDADLDVNSSTAGASVAIAG
jgi:hypothetical protein